MSVPLLFPGARVGVFAPSHRFDESKLAAGLSIAEGWGLELVEAPTLRAAHRYLAGSDVQRGADLSWALTDPSLDAAWLVRGGSGLARLLDGVHWEAVVDRPVIGFSDATSLLVALHQRAGISGVHGPVLHSLHGSDEASRAALRDLLFEGTGPPWSGHMLCPGSAEGPVVGGNLCVLASTCGTPDQLDARGAILVLEEVGEAPYRLDRCLHQLRRAGVLDGLVGVAVGELAPAHPDHRAILEEVFGGSDIPVLVDAPVGHGTRNLAFRVGARAHLAEGVLRWR